MSTNPQDKRNMYSHLLLSCINNMVSTVNGEHVYDFDLWPSMTTTQMPRIMYDLVSAMTALLPLMTFTVVFQGELRFS